MDTFWGKYNSIDKWHRFKTVDKYDRGLLESVCGQVVCYEYQLDDEEYDEPEGYLCAQCQVETE
jgi:hypothetical protein